MELVRNPTMVENVVVRVDEDFLTGKKKKICLVNPIKLNLDFKIWWNLTLSDLNLILPIPSPLSHLRREVTYVSIPGIVTFWTKRSWSQVSILI